jgi:hypothetical protein
MNSSGMNLTRTVWVIGLLGLLVSCQDTVPQRSTISPGSVADEIPTCPEGQELVEVTTQNTPTSPTNSADTFTINGKTYVCKDKAQVRPDNAVFWKSDFCGCKDGKPVTYGNCTTFCSSKNTNGAETLYANFTVNEAISLGGLGNVGAWCKTPLAGTQNNPECNLVAKDENNNEISLATTTPLGLNSITADISSLPKDKTFILTLVEKTSGAKSNSIQIIKYSSDTPITILGPIKNIPVSQYACMVREFSTDDVTGDIFYDNAYRLHFYFIPKVPPKPIPAGNSNLICHDIFNPLYSLIDQELYPRFEQKAGIFNLWDTTDPRFYDNNGNGTIDVNEYIIQKTRNLGGTIPSNSTFFQPFTWIGAPNIEGQAGNNTTTAQPLGYYMAPWIDQTTFRSYCLTSTQYNSSNPLFQAMKDILGVDTEGLYIGVKAPETVKDSSGNLKSGLSDYILIRESDLKAVWFYLKNGIPTVPTDSTVTNNAIYFYYPLNKTSPFVKTSTQRVFRVYSAQELNAGSGTSNGTSRTVGTGGSTSSGSATAYPPHDRKIGCVPKF